MVRSYDPAESPATRYSPSVFVTEERLMPRSAFLMVICAPTMYAPVGSLTVPVIDAVSWLKMFGEIAIQVRKSAIGQPRIRTLHLCSHCMVLAPINGNSQRP
jgi:hypothetical protein